MGKYGDYGLEADTEISTLSATVADDQAIIADKNAQIAAKDATIQQLTAKVAELQAKLTPPATTNPVVAKLAFAPPVLTNPLTINITPTARKAVIPADRDAIVKIPSQLKNVAGGIEIIGGRNVHLIGGQITYDSVDVTRALYIKGVAGATQRRNIHIEGLLIDGTMINGDAIDSDNQGVPTTVTLQNVDISLGLAGSFTANHSDGVQVWNGPNKLRVDGLILRNGKYQGFFLDPKKFYSTIALDTPALEFYNVHVIQDPAEYGYAFYNASAGTAKGSNVKVRAATSAKDRVSYPAGAWPFVTGYIGTPEPDSNFLRGKPGLAYVSPGYV